MGCTVPARIIPKGLLTEAALAWVALPMAAEIVVGEPSRLDETSQRLAGFPLVIMERLITYGILAFFCEEREEERSQQVRGTHR